MLAFTVFLWSLSSWLIPRLILSASLHLFCQSSCHPWVVAFSPWGCFKSLLSGFFVKLLFPSGVKFKKLKNLPQLPSFSKYLLVIWSFFFCSIFSIFTHTHPHMHAHACTHTHASPHHYVFLSFLPPFPPSLPSLNFRNPHRVDLYIM